MIREMTPEEVVAHRAQMREAEKGLSVGARYALTWLRYIDDPDEQETVFAIARADHMERIDDGK